MYNFPPSFYTDVRIETVYSTEITKKNGEFRKIQEKEHKCAFIRLFDSKLWYYTSISNVDNIQSEIDKLAAKATKSDDVYENEQIKKIPVNQAEKLIYSNNSFKDVSVDRKISLLNEYETILNDEPSLKNRDIYYQDFYKIKEIYSSKGSKVVFDKQVGGFSFRYGFGNENKVFSESFERVFDDFEMSNSLQDLLKTEIGKSKHFFENSKPIKPGKYITIMAPPVAGVFAHESFGHKSEADFMLNDENMKKEWSIGKTVGSPELSILDDGNLTGSGYTPFDDEGSEAEKTYLIKNGVLNGRLHSSETAAELSEGLTGNSRALDFEFEPIVRMTSTYIDSGNKTKEELFSEVKDGVYLDTIAHGSGMSRFTMTPYRAYMIKDGKIADPVEISVVTGNVMETLYQIDGVSDELEICSFLSGGCGKIEQYPLPVSFGGPYVRVKELDIQ